MPNGSTRFRTRTRSGSTLADAERIGVQTGDLVRVTTEIGYYVNRVWVTEGIRPGIVACSHHLGRWRLETDQGTDRWASAQVSLGRDREGIWRMRHLEEYTTL